MAFQPIAALGLPHDAQHDIEAGMRTPPPMAHPMGPPGAPMKARGNMRIIDQASQVRRKLNFGLDAVVGDDDDHDDEPMA